MSCRNQPISGHASHTRPTCISFLPLDRSRRPSSASTARSQIPRGTSSSVRRPADTPTLRPAAAGAPRACSADTPSPQSLAGAIAIVAFVTITGVIYDTMAGRYLREVIRHHFRNYEARAGAQIGSTSRSRGLPCLVRC